MGLPGSDQGVAGVVSAPGPDGKVCGYGCDAWFINGDCPTHFGQSRIPNKPSDYTRPRRMALDTAREYFRISREHTTTDTAYATMAALQGILRLMIYQVGGDQDGGYV